MKNLQSTLSRILKARTGRAVRYGSSQPRSRKLEQQDSCASASWQVLGTLLETQARVHAMNVVEPLSSCTSVKAEALDMALRESIRAQSLALVRFQEEGIISEELLEELLIHAAMSPTRAASQTVSGDACSQIRGTGK